MADFNQVLKCWDAVQVDYNGMGRAVLLRLFHDYTETQRLLHKFLTAQQNELVTNPAVAAHGALVLKKLVMVTCDGTLTPMNCVVLPLTSLCLHFPSQPLSDATVKVMGEKVGLEADDQASMRKVMDVTVTEIDGYYKNDPYWSQGKVKT
uniref:Myoglobin n=1 Tax=Scleropages formosus TaxID=113540 RepID=A0A8C9RRS6_SCLFO